MLTDLNLCKQVTKEQSKITHTHAYADTFTRSDAHARIPEGLVKRLRAFHQVFPIQTGLRADPWKSSGHRPAFGYGLIFKLGARWIESEHYQSSLY